MTDPTTAIQMDTSNLPSTIKKIHDWSDSGSTSGEALDTARQKIESINESDTTAQFWLVIMTDGSMTVLYVDNL